MNEIFKLKEKLDRAGINYIFRDKSNEYMKDYQIIINSLQNNFSSIVQFKGMAH